MRNIKFRGKVLHNNPMVNPDDGWVEGFYYQDLVNGEISHFIRSSECEWLINPETLGQFTGLKDKHGKEIYEGDILIDYVTYKTYIVEWRAETSSFVMRIDGTNQWYIVSSMLIEAIGNIHDNKKLLKGGEE